MTLINRFASALNIRPGEGRLVNLLLLHSFFVGINRVFLLSVSTSLFLTEFGANTLPYVYIATAVANSSIGFIYAWLGNRISFVNLLIANLIFQFVLVTGFWLLFGLTDATWPALAFMVSIELLWLLTNLEFWSLSVRIFNIQQGKRLFGVIGSGDTIASIVGGFTVPFFVSILGTHNLLLFVIVSIIASLVVILILARSYGERLSSEHPAARRTEEVVDRYANPLRNRYLVLIFAFAALATVSYYFLDNAFYGLAEINFIESDSLTAFLGIYFAAMALVQLIVQTFFNARIINRFGIAFCIILVPLVGTMMMLLTSGVAVIAGTTAITFIVMAVVRLIEYVIRATLTDTSQLTIYQSLPSTTRIQTQTQVESFVEPVLTGVTGVILLLIFGVLGWGLVHVIALSVLIGFGWTVVGVLLSREYPKALLQALSKRRLGNMNYLVKEVSITALIKSRLANSHAGDALYLINMLQETDPAGLTVLLPQLLSHNAVDVRQDVLRRIESLNVVSASASIQKLLATETNVMVRAAALRTAFVIDPQSIIAEAAIYLKSDEIPLRIAVMAGLMRSQNVNAKDVAEQYLHQLLRSSSPAERLIAAQAIGEIGLESLNNSLIMLLQDDDMEVRRSALVAAGKLKNAQLWPSVIQNLSLKTLRSAAISALNNVDSSVLPFLTAEIADIRREAEVGVYTRSSLAQQMVRICGRLRDTAILEAQMDFPDAAVREQILNALVQIHYQAHDINYIEDRIRQEIADDLWYLQGLILLNDDPLMSSAITYFLDHLRARVFSLCTFIYDIQTIMRARSDYYSNSESQQSYALEVLHITLSRELRLLVIALLDDNIRSRQGLDTIIDICNQSWLERERWLEKLLTEEMAAPWLKVTALYGIRRRNDRRMIRAVIQAERNESLPVRETAEWVLVRLDDHTLRSRKVLLTIEKMLLLKSASLFSHLPEPILFEIAQIVKDEIVLEGEQIIEKDDLGDCMYIIASGRVRVHDGSQTIAWLGEKDVFGELALLDSEPRNASVTAEEETYVLRLDQTTFYELTSDYPEVLRGIIRFLSQRLRETTRRSTAPQPVITETASA